VRSLTHSNRSVEELGLEFEKFIPQLEEQRYNQKAGLLYDKNLMEEISKTLVELSNEFLNSYEEPRSFYLDSIENISQARKLPLSLEIYEKRMNLISSEKFKIHGKPVNWGSQRQFNAQSSNDKNRAILFDEFIDKTKHIASLIINRFDISSQIYSLYDSTPLDSYLEREYYTYEKLHDLIISLGDRAKNVFLEASAYFAPRILEKENFEYYDDFYVARGKIFSPLDKYFAKKNPLKIINTILSQWGFGKEFQKIKVDSENREKKSPSAFCFGIKIPEDIRVVFKHVSPISDFGSVFHEFGHAIHGASGNPEDSYWNKYLIPRSVAETFSTFVELLLQNPLFLKQELDLPEDAVLEIIDRKHFMNLFFLVFYSANSLLKLEFWKRNYNLEQASSRYQELTKRFFWEIPGNYWLLHHIMSDYDMYSPSYVLASIRAKEMHNSMINEYGEEFWKDKQAGAVFRDLAVTRGMFDLSVWDMDPKPYLEEQSLFSFHEYQD
jgi:hypothetical protein